MFSPVNLSFTLGLNGDLRGSKLYRHVFGDVSL